jgi:hypothetical protein
VAFLGRTWKRAEIHSLRPVGWWLARSSICIAERGEICNQYRRMLKAFILFTLTAAAEIFGRHDVGWRLE